MLQARPSPSCASVCVKLQSHWSCAEPPKALVFVQLSHVRKQEDTCTCDCDMWTWHENVSGSLEAPYRFTDVLIQCVMSCVLCKEGRNSGFPGTFWCVNCRPLFVNKEACYMWKKKKTWYRNICMWTRGHDIWTPFYLSFFVFMKSFHSHPCRFLHWSVRPCATSV